MAGRPPGPERVAFPLRIEPKLLELIKRLAGAELRSTNAQIEILLREALQRRGVSQAKAGPGAETMTGPDKEDPPPTD